jgi:hypothetical protein
VTITFPERDLQFVSHVCQGIRNMAAITTTLTTTALSEVIIYFVWVDFLCVPFDSDKKK